MSHSMAASTIPVGMSLDGALLSRCIDYDIPPLCHLPHITHRSHYINSNVNSIPNNMVSNINCYLAQEASTAGN